MAKPKFLLVDGCPVPYEVAAQVYLVTRKAKQRVASCYRGEDAKRLLHRHGKHTQAEIHRMYPNISNPAGRSSHELRGDGVTAPVGATLPRWKIGVDSGGDSNHDKSAVSSAAHSYGWSIEHPYNRGVEGHHWNFKRMPKSRNLSQRARLVAIRARLPRK